MNQTQQLKSELWRRFGSRDAPSEWDGNVYGGGKLSQRFWEYFKAVELLDLDSESIVLDIGGGSPVTGVGFFSALLATAVKKVYVFDLNIALSATAPDNMEFVRSLASYDTLRAFSEARPEITHISSVSVFEHIEPTIREGMVRAVNDFFPGCSFVATFEFHAKRTYFEYQLTARTVSTLFGSLTNYYLDELCASPVRCENAFDGLFKPSRRTFIAPVEIPRWYPLAVRFIQIESVESISSGPTMRCG